MYTIAIVNNKGGVGKTTTAQNVSAAISMFSKGSNVLAVDLDAQGSLTKAFGIRIRDLKKTSGQFILGKASLEDAVISYKESPIDILPASSHLLGDEEQLKVSPQFPFNLKLALEQSAKKYNFVVIDCPPALSALTKIALVACNKYFVPLQPEYLSYEGLREFIYYANEISQISSEVELGGVFATRFNPKANKRFSKELIDNVSQQLGEKFLTTYVRENGDLYKAQAKGAHIFDYNSASNGAKDYYNLTKEIIDKI